MKTKRKRPNEELNFWQPATDMFSALVLILLLIILLLSLYLVNIDDIDQPDSASNSSVSNSNDGIGAVISRPDGGHQNADGNDGGGAGSTPDGSSVADLPGGPDDHDGGGGGSGAGTGTGEGPDKGIKSAVLVVMVDVRPTGPSRKPMCSSSCMVRIIRCRY